MSTDQMKDGVAFICDKCDEVCEPPKLGRGSEPRNFQECWALAKQAGWRAIRVKSHITKGDDWQHYCPECA